MGILQIDDLYKLEINKFMYSHSINVLPLPLQNVFTQNSNIHTHNTRHRLDPHIQSRNTSKAIHSFIHKAPENWYNLPQNIKQSKKSKAS